MGNNKEIGVDIESAMAYLSLANGRDADEGNRNVIRNPPIRNDSEQGDLRETMTILHEKTVKGLGGGSGAPNCSKCSHGDESWEDRWYGAGHL